MFYFELIFFLFIGFLFGELFHKIKLPKLLGYLICGIFIGNFYNIIEFELVMQNYLKEITSLALAIILLKSGLGIKKDTLQKVGKKSLLLGTIPNFLEGICIMLISLLLLDITFAEAGMLGFIISAVSPAIVIPTMSRIKDEGYGNKSGITTMNLASSSLDDVVSLTMFSIFLNIYINGNFSLGIALVEPILLINGMLTGYVIGLIFGLVYKYTNNVYVRVFEFLVLLAVVVILNVLGTDIHISSTIAIMTIGFIFADIKPKIASYISKYTSKVWNIFQIYLFFIIGSVVKINLIFNVFIIGIVLIALGLLTRVVVCNIILKKSAFTKEEKTFNMYANLPKATIQATLGAVPLSHSVNNGLNILGISVLAILITAPIGLLLIERNYKKLLVKE